MKRIIFCILFTVSSLAVWGFAPDPQETKLYARYDTAECRMLEAQTIKAGSITRGNSLKEDFRQTNVHKISLMNVVGVMLLCVLAFILLFCVLM